MLVEKKRTGKWLAEQLCVALHEQRVKASHMLADAIDNQVFIIAEIRQKLRTEYKEYLK